MNCFTANHIDFSKNFEKVQPFFDNLNNFSFIMPEQVENWQSDESRCSFFIKNLGNLGMRKGQFLIPDHYTFVSNDESRVDFVLHFYVKSRTGIEKNGYFEICADLNPMIEMMARRPLTNFVNILTANLHDYLNGKTN